MYILLYINNFKSHFFRLFLKLRSSACDLPGITDCNIRMTYHPIISLADSEPLWNILQTIRKECILAVHFFDMFVWHISKYNGKTLGQIAVEDFSSIKWLAESYRGDKNLYKAAAKIILNRHTGGQ